MEQTRALLCFCAWTLYTSLLFTSKNWSKTELKPCTLPRRWECTTNSPRGYCWPLISYYWHFILVIGLSGARNTGRRDSMWSEQRWWSNQNNIGNPGPESRLDTNDSSCYSRVTDKSWSLWRSQDFLLGKIDNNSYFYQSSKTIFSMDFLNNTIQREILYLGSLGMLVYVVYAWG